MRLSPSLPEISRAIFDNPEQVIAHFVSELTPTGGGFNYLEATKAIKTAFKGLYRVDQLTAAKRFNDGSVGAVANKEVVKLAAPLAFHRDVRVFDVINRTFQYGRARSASYRIPFFFVEGGVVKLYFLQPRKSAFFSSESVSFYGSIVKKYLLDKEFFGERTDVELVDVAEREKGQGRIVKCYNLAHIEIWEDKKIENHLTKILDALDFIEEMNLVTKSRRPLKDKDLPLFS